MFTVYHVKSTMEKKTYGRESDAKKLVAKLNQFPGRGEGQYAYATSEHYRTKVVHMVTRKNLMSGKEYQGPSNTPNYCSPASEAYWSM